MTDEITQFSEAPDGRPLYRRRHKKSDGREVLLYGYSPPDFSPTGDGINAPRSTTELRWHPLRQEWNIYAPARQNRTFKPAASADPLAPQISTDSPTEIPFADFELAIFENRFPGLSVAATSPAQDIAGVKHLPATGRCDVVVYASESTGSLATISQERRVLLVNAWIDRYKDLFDQGLDTVLPFENRGEEVGVTLSHPHGQIYAFDFTPPVQRAAANAFEDGLNFAALLKDWSGVYGIAEIGGIIAFTPPFARFPFETWLAPLDRRAGPWVFSMEETEGFAFLLGDMTRRYDALFGRACPLMLSLHAAPQSTGRKFHFTAQFYPLLRSADKVKYLASVEQSTGVFTVDVMPEFAAKALRER